MNAPALAYLLLGSNLGDRAAYLHAARIRLATAGDIKAISGLYETAAWGPADQPAYLNQAMALRTALAPEDLLAHCLTTEAAAGRERHERWGRRTLDVDILLYNGAVIDAPNLTVPHPRLPLRRFALVPLAEIAATVIHPQLHQTIGELLRCCPDPLAVRLWGST